MKLSIRLLDPAAIELEQTAHWYRNRNPVQAHALMTEVRRQLDRIVAFPNSYPLLASDVRCAPVHRFPYKIVYRILPTAIEVVSIFPDHRDPQLLARRIVRPPK